MKRAMRRGALALGVTAAVILGGGFASAADPAPTGYGDGSNDAYDTVTVTYTVVSYRAIALDDSDDMTAGAVAFGTVRQGGDETLYGPDLLYATTWTGDNIVVKMDTASLPGVALTVQAQNASGPGGAVGCDDAGTESASPVTLTTSDQSLITGIDDCGEAADLDYATDPPGYSENLRALTWARAATLFKIDTSGATNSTDYTTPVSTVVTFTIKAGGGA